MQKTLLSLIIIFSSALVHASDISTFFNAKAGRWNFVSNWSKNINEDGSTSEEWKNTSHSMQITNEAAGWSVYEDFCGTSDGFQLCGQSYALFQIDGDQLFLVDVDGNKTQLHIYKSTPTELSYKIDQGEMTLTNTEQISKTGIFTRVTQVQYAGKLIQVSFLSSKRSAR